MVRVADMAASLSPPPDQGPRCAGSLRSTPALRGFGYAFRPGTGPAVSPAFGRRGPAKPGDPPPPSRPAAARASDRTRSLSRPHPGASEAKGDSHDYPQLHIRPGPATPTRATSRPSRLQSARWCSGRTRRRPTRLPTTGRSLQARPAMSSSAPRGRSAARTAGNTSRSSSTIRAWRSRSTAPWSSQATARVTSSCGRATGASRKPNGRGRSRNGRP
jgi:hypothetical protein